jgi:ComF family protein
MRHLFQILSTCLHLVLPADCPVCSGELPWNATAGVCRSCWAGIRPILPPLCDRCGGPFRSYPGGDPPFFCFPCRKRPPRFHRCRSLGSYQGTLRKLLHRFKFDGRREIGPVLGSLMAVGLRLQMPERGWDAVVPVPLHRSRQRQRGFNPAGLLARAAGRSLGLPVSYRLLRRPRPTPPQTGLPRRQRLRNVRGAFQVRRRSQVRDLCILIVDDVVTTGATAGECARTLLRAGARRVDLLTAARSTGPADSDFDPLD